MLKSGQSRLTAAQLGGLPGPELKFNPDMPKKAMSISQQSSENAAGIHQPLTNRRGFATYKPPITAAPVFALSAPKVVARPADDPQLFDYVQHANLVIKQAVEDILEGREPAVSYHEVYSASESIYRFGPAYCDKLWRALLDIMKTSIQDKMADLIELALKVNHVFYSEASLHFGEELVRVTNEIHDSLKLIEKLLCHIDQGFLQTPTSRIEGIVNTGFNEILTGLSGSTFSTTVASTCCSFMYKAAHSQMEEAAIFEKVMLLLHRIMPEFARDLPNDMLELLKEYITSEDFFDLETVVDEGSVKSLLETIIHQTDNLALFVKSSTTVATFFKDFHTRYAELALNTHAIVICNKYEDYFWQGDEMAAQLFARALEKANLQIFRYILAFTDFHLTILRVFGNDSLDPKGKLAQLVDIRVKEHKFVKYQHAHVASLYKRNFHQEWRDALDNRKEFEELMVLELSKHLDKLVKFRDYDAAKTTIENALLLLPVVNMVITFMHYYQQDMSKRLLAGTSNPELEKLVLNCFKKEKGTSATQNMESMLADIETSRDITKNFKQNVVMEHVSIAPNFKVLTEHKWPKRSMISTAQLPSDMLQVRQSFEAFYQKKHAKRKLSWYLPGDLVVVGGKFNGKYRELHANLFQALILLLFNDKDELTYDQIAQETGINKEDLNPALHSLVMGRVHILRIERGQTTGPSSSRIGKVEAYTAHNRFRVADEIHTKTGVPTTTKLVLTGYNVSSHVRDERTLVREQIKQSRNLELQAAIVRVMKTTRRLKHVELFQRVAESVQERGQVVMADFKRALDELMAPGNPYVVRDSNDPGVYLYSV